MVPTGMLLYFQVNENILKAIFYHPVCNVMGLFEVPVSVEGISEHLRAQVTIGYCLGQVLDFEMVRN